MQKKLAASVKRRAKEAIAIIKGIARGERAIEQGQTVSHQEAKERISRWLSLSAANEKFDHFLLSIVFLTSVCFASENDEMKKEKGPLLGNLRTRSALDSENAEVKVANEYESLLKAADHDVMKLAKEYVAKIKKGMCRVEVEQILPKFTLTGLKATGLAHLMLFSDFAYYAEIPAIPLTLGTGQNSLTISQTSQKDGFPEVAVFPPLTLRSGLHGVTAYFFSKTISIQVHYEILGKDVSPGDRVLDDAKLSQQ